MKFVVTAVTYLPMGRLTFTGTIPVPIQFCMTTVLSQ